MAKKGAIINNSITKEKMLFLKTAAGANGQLLEIEMTVGLEARFQMLGHPAHVSFSPSCQELRQPSGDWR